MCYRHKETTKNRQSLENVVLTSNFTTFFYGNPKQIRLKGD